MIFFVVFVTKTDELNPTSPSNKLKMCHKFFVTVHSVNPPPPKKTSQTKKKRW